MCSIKLRPLSEKDAPLMLEWLKDKDVTRYFRFDSSSSTIESVVDFINESQNIDESVHFAIVNADSDEYLGTISLKNIDSVAKNAEYAIVLHKNAHGKGYAQAATDSILDFGFNELGLERIYFNVVSANERAIRFYEKYGFINEGEFKSHINIRGEVYSLKWFRMMRDEYGK